MEIIRFGLVTTSSQGQKVAELVMAPASTGGGEGVRGRCHGARAMAIYASRKLAGMKQEAIAKVFGLGGYSAISRAVGRMQLEIEKKGKVAQRCGQIRSRLQR